MLKRIFFGLSFLAVVAFVLALGYGFLRVKSLDQPLQNASQVSQEPVCLELKKGEGLSHFLRKLQAEQLALDAQVWRLWARYEGLSADLKAGEYCLNEDETPRTLTARMIAGDVQRYRFTIIPGWNVWQLLEALAEEKRLQQQLDYATSSEDGQALAKALGLPVEHAEGWFAPDTYFFTRSMTDKDLLLQAFETQQKRLKAAWAKKADDLPYVSAYEALIMASIVEKETGVAYERPEIAGVFVRRLNKGMKLQTDPTIIYGIGKDYDGNIRKRDITRATPYNTYVIAGMPPTPIAMPSQAAIEAALNPKAGNTLYFVAKGDGSHVFSRTYQEHSRAVREYQLKRRQDYRSSPK